MCLALGSTRRRRVGLGGPPRPRCARSSTQSDLRLFSGSCAPRSVGGPPTEARQRRALPDFGSTLNAYRSSIGTAAKQSALNRCVECANVLANAGAVAAILKTFREQNRRLVAGCRAGVAVS